jgi:tetratricopeptide (TPR) repeat protein
MKRPAHILRFIFQGDDKRRPYAALRSLLSPAIALATAGLALSLFSCGRHKSEAETNPILMQQGIRPLTEAIAKDTSSPENWYKRGLALHNLKQDSLALEDFYRAATLDTNHAGYASTIGDLLFEHKDVTNALKWLQRALRHDPEDPKAHLKAAKLMIFTKDFPSAFNEINIVLRRDTYNPEGYFLKGIIYKEIKDTSKAISSFQTVMNVAPDYREAAIQLGILYNDRNNPLGLQYLENAFKMDTTDVLPLYMKGQYYQNKNKYEEAKAQYARCILNDIQYADAYFATGFILLQQDSLEKARRQFDHVTRIEPQNAGAYYNRGLCSELMGDKESAIADYRQALTFDKDYKAAKEGLKRLGQ